MRRWLALALGVALVASCTGGGGDDDADPSTTTEEATSTTLVDRSGVALAGVPGQTTSTIVEVGTAKITGSVEGPSGLVVGATVRIERLVAGREIRTDLVTGPDGRFLLENVPGGRYRVRSFLPPTLAQAEPEVLFLEDGAEHDLPLTMTDHSGVHVLADAAPEPPLLDDPVNVVALVVTQTVGADGVVHSAPVIGVTVELAGLGRWRLRNDAPTRDPDDTTSSTFEFTTTTEDEADNVATTDSSGRVRFELRCTAPGAPGLYLRIPVRVSSAGAGPDGSTTTTTRVETQSFDLELPACVDPATTTTTTAPTTTTTAPP